MHTSMWALSDQSADDIYATGDKANYTPFS